MLNGLVLSRVTAFVEVATALNFTVAARKLNVSQPALTRTIHLFEDDVGARLFDRDTRNVQLTPAGREILPIVERLLRDVETAANDMSSYVEGKRGIIRIAAIPTLVGTVLPLAITAFSAERPEIRFHIDDALSGPVAQRVANGEADFGLTTLPTPDRRLSFEPLLLEPVGLVCRKDDPLALRQRVQWADIPGHNFIAMAPGTGLRNITDAAFLQSGLAVEPRYGCSVVASVGRLVMAGLGITALPKLCMHQLDAQELVWKRLDGPFMSRESGLVLRTGYSLAPTADHFLHVMRSAFQTIQAKISA
jgi:LysR family carnitine catabolism transcriptional activator